jgi:hypothetical protein
MPQKISTGALAKEQYFSTIWNVVIAAAQINLRHAGAWLEFIVCRLAPP